jgi:hypothetical protein
LNRVILFSMNGPGDFFFGCEGYQLFGVRVSILRRPHWSIIVGVYTRTPFIQLLLLFLSVVV